MTSSPALVAPPTSFLDLPGCNFSRTKLEIEPGLPVEHWQRIGDVLRAAEEMVQAVQFWIGDWLRYGERNYGEKYAQAVEATGYAIKTLQNAQFVAEHVSPSRRRERLSFSIHAEVASMKPKDQDRWLAKAETEGMTRKDLRIAIKREKFRKQMAKSPLGDVRNNAFRMHLEHAQRTINEELIAKCPDPEFSRRVYDDVLDEISVELAELRRMEREASDPRVRIIDAFREYDFNPQSTNDLVRLTRLSAEVVLQVMRKMESEGLVELIRRGGQTEVARGDVVRVWHWKSQPLGSSFNVPRVLNPID